MTIHNDADTPATLTAASSPACGILMLHQSQDTSGMAMMMSVPSIKIPAHGSVTFAPGGYHLMCMAPKMKIGAKVPVTLTLQPGGALTYLAPVYSATTAP
jgi:copper(I)-binding protein